MVHLDVPESIVNGHMTPEAGWLREPGTYRNVTPLQPGDEQVERAADLLADADAPMIHAGSGVVHARAFAELARVAELAPEEAEKFSVQAQIGLRLRLLLKRRRFLVLPLPAA